MGDGALEPAWTSFATRVFFSTYDVTSLLQKPGKHVLAAELGNGWWNPLPLKFWGYLNLQDGLATGEPRLIAQLELTYSDNTTITHCTSPGGDWKVGSSSTLKNNIYLGEKWDANRIVDDWTAVGYDDSSWSNAALPAEPPPPPPPPPAKCTSACTLVEVLPAGPSTPLSVIRFRPAPGTCSSVVSGVWSAQTWCWHRLVCATRMRCAF